MLDSQAVSTIPTLVAISQATQSYNLQIITGGSYDYSYKNGSHAMALTTGADLYWLNSGPCMGNGSAMNPKRAKLCGLTTALYMALWICKAQHKILWIYHHTMRFQACHYHTQVHGAGPSATTLY